MGINSTKNYDKELGTPYFPQKIERDELNYIPVKKQFIVGNGGLFIFDTESYKMTKLSVNFSKINVDF
jgi:hypothetical protein